jgi:hypothetical protein
MSSPNKIYYNGKGKVSDEAEKQLKRVALKTSSLFSISYENFQKLQN